MHPLGRPTERGSGQEIIFPKEGELLQDFLPGNPSSSHPIAGDPGPPLDPNLFPNGGANTGNQPGLGNLFGSGDGSSNSLFAMLNKLMQEIESIFSKFQLNSNDFNFHWPNFGNTSLPSNYQMPPHANSIAKATVEEYDGAVKNLNMSVGKHTVDGYEIDVTESNGVKTAVKTAIENPMVDHPSGWQSPVETDTLKADGSIQVKKTGLGPSGGDSTSTDNFTVNPDGTLTNRWTKAQHIGGPMGPDEFSSGTVTVNLDGSTRECDTFGKCIDAPGDGSSGSGSNPNTWSMKPSPFANSYNRDAITKYDNGVTLVEGAKLGTYEQNGQEYTVTEQNGIKTVTISDSPNSITPQWGPGSSTYTLDENNGALTESNTPGPEIDRGNTTNRFTRDGSNTLTWTQTREAFPGSMAATQIIAETIAYSNGSTDVWSPNGMKNYPALGPSVNPWGNPPNEYPLTQPYTPNPNNP